MVFLLVIYGLKHNPWPSGSDPCAIVHGPLASLASAESPPQLHRHSYNWHARSLCQRQGVAPWRRARVLRLCSEVASGPSVGPQATRCEPLACELGAVKVAFVDFEWLSIEVRWQGKGELDLISHGIHSVFGRKGRDGHMI